MDIPTTTAMRILKTLEEFDAVRKEGGKYKIGDFISNFAYSVRARSTIGERINNYLVGLTRKSGETSHMCVPAGNSGFVLRECSTWQSLRSISVEGTFIDLSCSSAGKIFLADSLKNNPDFFKRLQAVRQDAQKHTERFGFEKRASKSCPRRLGAGQGGI